MKDEINRGRRYVSKQVREIQALLDLDEETTNTSRKLSSIDKEALKRSLASLVKTRDELIKKYKQTKIERAILLAKKTNEELLNSFKPIFSQATNVEESFETFYERKKGKRK